MTVRNVAIRLGTEGKADVQRDFGDVKAAGVDANAAIAAAADKGAAAADRQMDRWRRMAEAARAAGDAAAQQAKFNAILGVDGGTGKSAAESAGVFAEAAKEQEAQAAAAAKLRAVLDPLSAAQDRLNKELAEYIHLAQAGVITEAEQAAAAGLATQRYQQVADQVKKTGNQHQLSSVQVMMMQSAIFRSGESLAAGMPMWRIAVQQGGELAAALGMGQGGVGASLNALTSIFTPARVGLAAFVTLMALGEAGTFSYRQAMGALENTVSGVGRASKLTAGELDLAAQSGAQFGDLSVSAARKQAAALAQAGVQGAANIKDLISVGRDYAHLTGQDLADAQKKLAAAMVDPAKGAEELNAQFGFLTQTQVEHIKTMAALGDKQGAVTALTRALKDEIRDAGPTTQTLGDQMGILGGKLSDAWEWWSKLNDQIERYKQFGPGGPPPIVAQVEAAAAAARAAADAQAAARKAISDAAKRGADAASGVPAVKEQADFHALQVAQQNLRTGIAAAAAQGDAQSVFRNTSAYQAYSDAISRVTDSLGNYIPKADRAHKISEDEVALEAAKQKKDKAEVARLSTDIARLKVGDQLITNAEADRAATDAGAVAAAKVTQASDKHAQALAREAAAMEANIKGAWDLVSAYGAGDAAALKAEATRKAETDATKKGADLKAAVARQIRLAVADAAVDGAKGLSSINAQAAAQAAANDAVAAGATTTEAAARQMEHELALRPQIAAALEAEGVEREKLNKQVDDTRAAYAKSDAEQARASARQSIASQNDNIALLKMEIAMVGDLTGAREREVAVEQALQDMKRRGIVVGSAEGQTSVSQAAQQADLDRARAKALFVTQTRRSQADQLELDQAELNLVGATELAHDRVIQKLQTAQQLKLQGIDTTSAEGQAILANADAVVVLAHKLTAVQSSWEELKSIGDQLVDDIGQGLSPDQWGKWGDMGKAILRDIAVEFERLTLLNPIKNLLTGGSSPTLGGVGGLISSLFGTKVPTSGLSFLGQSAAPSMAGFTSILPGFAGGTDSAPGGLSWVGEDGPELVNLPRGSQVFDSRRSAAVSGGGVVLNITLNAQGAGPREVDQLKAQVAQLKADMPAIAVNAVGDAQARRILR